MKEKKRGRKENEMKKQKMKKWPERGNILKSLEKINVKKRKRKKKCHLYPLSKGCEQLHIMNIS